ncbi:MAG: ABC transporter ATP-binding protein [Firmicutes bacterium]|nr:ABC transporter ATP-binding protein [Bacillota bacterium]
MAKIIEVSNASYSYNGKEYIWQDVNLDVEQGDSVCILGANGCGKTTLFNCIAGNFQLAKGYIKIDGKPIKDYSITELAKTIGIVYQEHSVSFPYKSIEVVRMGRTPYLGMFQTPSQADTDMAYSIMEEMGIAHLAEKPYSRISGGQRQLVLIARTLCQTPKAILFDEPTSHLDFKNQALVMKTLRNLSAKGMTIIMTSHSPAHAWQVSTNTVLMGKGGIIAQGAPKDVMTSENLEKTYDVKVKIHKSEIDDGAFFCEPAFEEF